MQISVKEDRDLYIGGSDIPKIMGISTFQTRWELLQEKAGLLENNFNGNSYTEYGDKMEPKIRNYINEDLKDKFVEGKLVIGDIRCHTDGENKTTILEIKTTSQIHEKIEDYKYYLVQLLFYMIHTKRKKGILAIYERPEDFNETFNPMLLSKYEINIKDYKELCEDINLAVEQFRIDLQKVRENPFLTEEDLLPKEVISLSNKVVELEKKLALMKTIEEEKDNTKKELKESMEKYGIKRWTTPNGIKLTLVEDKADEEIKVDAYDEDKFIEENLELHEEYHNKLAEYKVTKIEVKKGRKGYVKITIPKET